MKFIFTADLHLRIWPDNVYRDKVPLRLCEIFDTFEKMCQTAVERGISTIIIGGDVNHTKSIIHARPFVLFKNILEKYSNLYFIILHGNHDGTDKQDISESAINLLKSDNVSIITKTYNIEDIYMVPYSMFIADDINKIKKAKILISHFGLSDAELSTGISIKEELSSSKLKRFPLVLLGHYHKPQHLNNVYYVGSPIQFRRDEVGEEKRFLIVDSDTLEVESIPTEGYRKYREIIIDKSNIHEIENIDTKDDYIVIRNRTGEKLEVNNMVVIDEFEEEDYQIRLSSSMSISDMMKTYMEIEKISEKERDEYLKIGLESIGGDECKK